jgi:hypothetical protein
LTNNVVGKEGKNGIEIAVGEVTLDLAGFSIRGVKGSRDGVIVFPGQRNIVVINGVISGWGMAGLRAFDASNCQLQDLRAYDNGSEGLAIGPGSVVTRCVAENNGGDGIVTAFACTVKGCASRRNGRGPFGGDGIDIGDGSVITDCSTRGNAAAGIYADLGCTVVRCTARENKGDGIFVGAHSTVSACASSFNGGDGIHAGEGVVVTGCSASLNSGDGIEVSSFCQVLQNGCEINGLLTQSGAGIRVIGLDNRIEGNHVAMNAWGIKVEDVGNLIVKNSAVHDGAGPADDYVIISGNRVGPITEDPATAGPWANFR